MAAFALHNYIRINSEDDTIFTMLEQHPSYIHRDELADVPDGDTTNKNMEERSTGMKVILNNIADLLWNAR
ncbi:hypothetical protein SESBI_08142 [Sesbania bispinosa]|nr:hypothetical protein SESBI_08142 [Sesbania bispinosa]